MRFQLVATCLFGLEHLLGEEIDELGYNRISTIDGRVTFEGDSEAVALSNIFLRYKMQKNENRIITTFSGNKKRQTILSK